MLSIGSVNRISECSDMSFLLPFILSHHDHTTSTHWPNIPEHGIKMLPSLMLSHPGYAHFTFILNEVVDFFYKVLAICTIRSSYP